MKNLLLKVLEKNNGEINTAWVIGAGNGNDLENYRELTSKNTYLIEAHPRQVELLKKRISEASGEHLIPLAVTVNEVKEVSLLTFNNAMYSSLNQPLELLNHYPNLRVAESISVPAKSISGLFNEESLDAKQNHVLVLEASGQSLNLMKAMPVDKLQAFSWLIVSSYSEPLYQNDANAKEIADWLQTIGFDLIAEDADAFYPQNRQLFSRNPIVIQQHQLQHEIIVLQSQLGQLQKTSQQQINELTSNVFSLTKEKTELVSKVDTQTKLVAEYQAQVDALTKEKTSLTSARDAQSKLAAERQAQLDALAKVKAELTNERDVQAKLATERQAQVDALTKEKTELIGARDALTKLATERQAQVEALTKEKVELISARDTQTKLATEYQTQIDTLNADKKRLIQSLDESNQKLTTAQQKIKSNESEMLELMKRQQAMQEELIKAEAQLDLIKELIFSDSDDSELDVSKNA